MIRSTATRPSARAMIGAVVIALLATGLANAQMPPALVNVATIEAHTGVAAGVSFAGTVMPARRSAVGSAVDGRVVEFYVNQGDRVTEGQPLAQLRTRTLEIQRDAAKAEAELRRQELLELKNGARSEDIDQAKARMLAAKSTMEFTANKLTRSRNLIANRAVSQEQLQDDESLAENALQRYLEAKAAYELLIAGERAERIAQAEARVAAAEEAVAQLEDMLEKHTIVSPFDGYVVAEHTEVGQWIKQGELVAEIVEVDKVEIEVQVLENYIPHLRLGAEARIDIDALAGADIFVGEVVRIVPQADLRSRSFPVRVQLQNEEVAGGGPLIKPGMFASVTLPVQQKQEVLMAPKDALVLGGPQPTLFVVTPDPSDPEKLTVRSAPVRLGIAKHDLIEVSGPIKAGDRVVVEGNERLFPGREIQILPGQGETPQTAARATTP